MNISRLSIILSGLLGGSCLCNAFVTPNSRRAITINGDGMDTMKIARFLDNSALRFSSEGAEMESKVQRLEASSTSSDIDLMEAKTLLPNEFIPYGILATIILSLVLFQLTLILNEHLINIYDIKETARYALFANFFKQNGLLSFALIFTHTLPLTFITPYIFLGVEEKGELIQQKHEQFNPFLLKLSFAMVAIGLGIETCWHINDSWYYIKDFHTFNFGFYFFLTTAFSLWAAAMDTSKIWNALNFLVLAAICVWYPVGMSIDFGLDHFPSYIPDGLADFMRDNVNEGGWVGKIGKIPCIVGFTIPFVPIWLNGRKIFENDMNTVVFFSVLVNLAFIMLLGDYDELPDIPTIDDLSQFNYIYHILHDLAGTEAGVIYFAYLISAWKPEKYPKELA